ncbi:DUF6745 domain-containing protein [Pseudonocardia asaccharolytica]|uniref:DUF6745 domain-containing protein n=1 Tax=Pseudonocardia asaccharolytica DSM 44247 = NBRC 16224 TaxID=1123024 RepID=A0A511D441_9PSEU|nr:hypothetical protein [Pseudonocardia asaccharolytica]GEL17668.1 hypothetical protein PA7_15050 [Pseudonocardia asaccharolytica DSM 44247 = NBRC 16224]
MFDGALTADQLTHIRGVRDDWMRVGLSTERCDRPAAEAAVRAAYTAAGLEAPPRMVWADSPLGGARVVPDQLGAQLGGQLGVQLGVQLWGQLGVQLGVQLWGQLGDQLWDQLRDRLWTQLGDQLRGQLGDRLWGEVGGHLCPWRDAYWLASHQCARPIAGLPPSPQLDALAAAVRAVGWWWPMRDVAVLTDRPTQLHRDERGRLHREGGPAVAYADGWALHYRHGTPHPALTAGEAL